MERGRRHRIEHIETLDPADLPDRLSRLFAEDRGDSPVRAGDRERDILDELLEIVWEHNTPWVESEYEVFRFDGSDWIMIGTSTTPGTLPAAPRRYSHTSGPSHGSSGRPLRL